MTKYYPAKPNQFAQGAAEVKIPLQMDPRYRDIGARTKIARKRTTVKSTNTTGSRKYYGFRAFMTKEQKEIPILQPIAGLKNLLEHDDISELPQDILDDIKSLMRRGVNPSKKDVKSYYASQGRELSGEEDEEELKMTMPRWKNALELIDTAYHVAGLKKPDVATKGWKQYLDLLPHAVELLADKYGLHGPNSKWRITTPINLEEQAVYEAEQFLLLERMDRSELMQYLLPKEKKSDDSKHQPQSLTNLQPPVDYQPSHVGKRRFFVSIAGSGQTEVDAKSLDEVIDQLTNKMRRHGVKVKIDQRDDDGAVLSFWYQDIKRERIVVRQIGS